ncbi:transmembrane protein [Blastocladiella britannica]|nr:transmembrane protein [Blastocladiella britannica]
MKFLDDFVRSWSYDLPVEVDRTSSIYGSWFLTPTQHAVEFVALNVLFLFGFFYFLGKALLPGTPIDRAIRTVKQTATGKRSRLNVGMALVLTASLALVTYHKANANTLYFMLQPCHVSMVSLIAMLLWKDTSRVPHVALNIYFHTVWGTLLAIAQPDLRDAKQFLEAENFWFEHWVLLITPLVMIWSNRFAIFPTSFDLAMASFLAKSLFHSAVLSVVALYSGHNLNYMLEPPLGPLEVFQEFYRLAMYAFCCLLTYFTRYVLVEFVLRVLPRRARAAPVKKQQ